MIAADTDPWHKIKSNMHLFFSITQTALATLSCQDSQILDVEPSHIGMFKMN